MIYVGIDYHKSYSHATAVDQQGAVIASQRLSNDLDSLYGFFDDVGGPVKAVLESSRTWGILYDMLEQMDCVESVTLAHPLKVRMIAEAKVKTDKIDSETLAQLLRVNLIPAAYIPPKQSRDFKNLVRQRLFLVKMRTSLKNRLHVLLDRIHIPKPSVTDMFGKRGMEYLRGLPLEGIDGEILHENLDLLEQLNRLVRSSEKAIKDALGSDNRVEVLQTMPGIGVILATVVALEIDSIDRFTTPDKLAAYAGLVPSTYSSGGRTSHGKLIKMSNKWLRWAFIEAAWATLRSSAYCRTYFEKIKRRKGAHIAIVALARRMSLMAWHMLKEKRPYEERPAKQCRFVSKDSDPAALPHT